MSRAAKQCRKWIEATYPGVRVSRKACRNTAGGSVSQHSAWKPGVGSYDSNAIDIFGPEELPREAEQAFVDDIVKALKARKAEWSIRIILWRVPDHHGHAHVDFWPTCLQHRWCGRDIAPMWESSTGALHRTQDPLPENGPYQGPGLEDEMPRALFEDMIAALFAVGQEFQPADGAAYWIGKIDTPNDPEWQAHFWPAYARQLRKDNP